MISFRNSLHYSKSTGYSGEWNLLAYCGNKIISSYDFLGLFTVYISGMKTCSGNIDFGSFIISYMGPTYSDAVSYGFSVSLGWEVDAQTVWTEWNGDCGCGGKDSCFHTVTAEVEPGRYFGTYLTYYFLDHEPTGNESEILSVLWAQTAMNTVQKNITENYSTPKPVNKSVFVSCVCHE